MASVHVAISAPVGIRNGQTVMPNQPRDLDTVTKLLDRIPVSKGGSAEIGGVWSTDRNALIVEVAAQITVFQTVNQRKVIDGVIDPRGGTLGLMNQLASEPAPATITAKRVPAPGGLAESFDGVYSVVDVTTIGGQGPLAPTNASVKYERRLIRVEGTSINWFGVVVPRNSDGAGFGKIPHINFTPTPIQGGYSDATYDSFGGWDNLWRDYTAVIGGQVAGSGADQILVIPFYQTSQSGNLGDFLLYWKEAVSAVVTAAIDSIDPYYLRDSYTFDRIVSSSFSNGYVAHQGFHTKAAGAAAMTDVLFDLDGQAGGSTWRPAKGVIYLNRQPGPVNPVGGRHWYVGGRWHPKFKPLYGGGNVNGHAASRNHLLYHGLWQFCT
jgi:hypothetical protein